MIVLDAAAVIDVVLDQPSAGWVLDQLVGQDVVAPAHQSAEVLSALARLVRAGHLDPATAADALSEAMSLPQRLVVATASHVQHAFELRERIRVLDALYVALAVDLRCPVVTTDRRLAAAGAPAEIRAPQASPG